MIPKAIPKARVLSRDPAQPVSPFSAAGTTPFCLGSERLVWGTILWCYPSPSLSSGSWGLPCRQSFLFSMNRWEAWNERRKPGEGWGTAPGRRPWQPVKEAVFQGLPASPFPSSLAAPIPRALRPSHYPSAHSREKGFKELTFMKVWKTRCTSYKAGQYLAAEPFLQMLLFKCSDAGQTGGLAPSLRCLCEPLGLGRCVLRSMAVLQWRVSSATRRPSLHPSPPEAS